MKPYKVTEVDEDLVDDFIQRAANNHRAEGRDINKIEDNIRTGKLGEIAYKSYCGDSINEVDWSGVVQMDGLDFKRTDGTGIQVKTLNADTTWCSFPNWKWDVLVVMRLVGNEVHLLGEFEREYIKGIARKSNWSGWYFNPENC
jgi:hypothetical protein